MHRYVAFLRGMNLGKRRIKNEEIEGRELYWLPSGGLLESDLDLKAIEKLLGADTRRTMGTIEQIAAKLA
jgi:uncharacterized protein (DUF1697 family)